VTGPVPEAVQQMFTRIVGRYDLMNRLMTAGRDRVWRARAAALVAGGRRVLDLGCGTGDLSLAVAAAGVPTVVGIDFAPAMVRVAEAKRRRHPMGEQVRFLVADALALPFADETFDGVVNAFVLRNLADLDQGLVEARRVLRPGGRLVCLEITHPPAWLAPLFWLYFGQVVPLLGGIVAGDRGAYAYLPASLRRFPPAPDLARRLERLGFTNVRYERLGLGTVALHLAERPPHEPRHGR